MVGTAQHQPTKEGTLMLTAALKKQLQHFDIDASFTLSPGITALFGPSGSGKSMLVKLLGGLEQPDEGMISLSDKILFRKDPHKKAHINTPPHKRSIGFVFQDHRLFPHMTVLGNLKYGIQKDNRSVPFDDVVKLLDIAPLLSRKPKDLSGGESQRVAIGRALLSAPDILIMDEPLSSLDRALKDDILRLIERVKNQFGQTILYITHSLDEVLHLADNLILLERGKIRAQGPLMETLSRQDLFPLAGEMDAGTVFSGVITSHDDGFNLTTIDSKAGPVFVTGVKQTHIGDTVRIRLRARDIALSPKQNTDISMLNQFKGIITEFRDHTPGVVLVTLDVGLTLFAAITLKSKQNMGLEIGSEVWALVKSVTVDSVER